MEKHKIFFLYKEGNGERDREIICVGFVLATERGTMQWADGFHG